MSSTMTLFQSIRNQLAAGRQCPCGLAAELQISERELFPYLAEMLATEQVTLVPDGYFNKKMVTRPSEFQANLAATIEAHERLGEHVESEVELVEMRTSLWYDFFKAIDTGDPYNRPIYHIALTSSVAFS